MKLWEIASLPYGKNRRELFKSWLQNPEYFLDGIPVNKRGQCNDKDPDLSYMIKKGILKRDRPRVSNKYKSSTGRQTYLVLS
jgi:hypothetical protein